jgi:hypothetical protein
LVIVEIDGVRVRRFVSLSFSPLKRYWQNNGVPSMLLSMALKNADNNGRFFKGDLGLFVSTLKQHQGESWRDQAYVTSWFMVRQNIFCLCEILSSA